MQEVLYMSLVQERVVYMNHGRWSFEYTHTDRPEVAESQLARVKK